MKSENQSEPRSVGSDPLEFEAVDINASKTGQRIKSFLLMIIAIGIGAAGWAFYGEKIMVLVSEQSSEIPLIEADLNQVKRRPDNPGGIHVPHLDMGVYGPIHRSAGGQPMGVPIEKLLPPPEKPLPKQLSKTWSKKGAEFSTSPTFPIPRGKPKRIDSTPRIDDVRRAEKPSPPPLVSNLTAKPLNSVPVEKSLSKSAGQLSSSEQDHVGKQKKLLDTKIIKESPSITELSSDIRSPILSKNIFRIQLAATRTSMAAQGEWVKLRKRNSDLLGGLQMQVTRIDLGGAKGVFYRLRAGPLSGNTQARELCRILGQRKTGCLVIRPGK